MEKREEIKIVRMLSDSEVPISGKELAGILDVSRQVIVQDMALLRAQDYKIISTNQATFFQGKRKPAVCLRSFTVDSEVEEELKLILIVGDMWRMYLYIIRYMELSGQN